jgi:hypothetical protein
VRRLLHAHLLWRVRVGADISKLTAAISEVDIACKFVLRATAFPLSLPAE